MKRLYEDVNKHPFFQGLSKIELQQLLEKCQSKEFKRFDIIFHANEQRKGLLLLLSGFVEVCVGRNDKREVLEVLQPGELIGLSSVADFLGEVKSDFEYGVEVRAIEQAEAIFIPYPVIELLLKEKEIYDYLFTQLAVRLKDIYGSLAEQVVLSRKVDHSGSLVTTVKDMMSKTIISVESMAPIETAAFRMADERTSSVLVLEHGEVLGIITERDIVSRVIAKKKAYDDPVKEIMTENPYTISQFVFYYEALSTMILHGIKHLPVTQDEQVVGIITLSDLMRKKSDNMIRTIRTIEQSEEETIPVIKKAIYEVVEALLQDDVPVFKILESITKLYDRLVKRCIEIAVNKLRVKDGLTPPVSFCFYQMGSAGRGEQFLLTDQDHFLVYEQTEEDQHEYFARLSEEIVHLLERSGFERCQGEMMASNPRWRGSIDTWIGRIHSWSIHSSPQNMLLAQNFFSYRFLYGNEQLHQKFEKSIQQQMIGAKIFLFHLHEQEKESLIPTLDHPIRSLFRLERKSLDIKKEILFPYHHSLQLLSLLHGIVVGTPFTRIDRLVQKKVFSEDFAKDVKTAIGEIMCFYVKQRWKQHKNNEKLTSVLVFTHLTTREKEDLLLSVKTLKEMQNLVNVYF
ncbi:DUF294 nucleotidyltransferase-like domain-containing protein [Ferdinandcohnia quinoae]|uniref:DUF294 nucleotidyltransferase-like domain-containing protein n=1 Tax=Fredinandcohnia quinoae TaxID=2918902 RepID=A0AAW5E315_9BACI|nr:DUF294 nucleotidyltransferase-like domain-containing protein [Fredinandcohnia sp. SECRCQ15]MCH1625174.1 DUF294 nucleotidyltransferase-like domain-containing protein [Fredinandcohnia sp. SECRCQ15]